MSLYEQLRNEVRAHDPWGFKAQGTGPDKLHKVVNESYAHQEFPKLVYRGEETKTVSDSHELESALASGWSDKPAV